MYTQLNIDRRTMKILQRSQRQQDSFFAKGGEDKRDLPQLLDPKYAISIINYIITSDGGLTKRQGQTLLVNTGSEAGTMLENWTSDILMLGYGHTLAAYEISSRTLTVIKNDFVQVGMEGAKYGDYFFIASQGDKIGRVSRTLNYDSQTANFTVGDILTGTTSGATAIILQDADAGTTGTLTLGSIVGVFQDDELITDPGGGSALANGTVSFTYTVITAAPFAKRIAVYGSRLIAGNLLNNPFSIQYSGVDVGGNPPFNSWPIGTLATDGGIVSYRNAGEIEAIESLGQNIILFGSTGKWAFTIDVIDVGGVQQKVDSTVMYRQDFGGFRDAISTPKGVFYVNEAGLWQLISVGQPNIPFSDQEGLGTLLLGINYFKDIDLSNCSLGYDKRLNTVFISCAKNSAQNNLVLAYNVDQKAISELTGLSLSRLIITEDFSYSFSSVNGKVYRLFDGYSDDGVDIWTRFYTEEKSGGLETRQMLLGTYIQGIFSLSTTLKICYNIYDRQGNFILDKLCQTWLPNSSVTPISGYGEQPYGDSAYGGSVSNGGTMIESFSGARDYIRNFQRIQIDITGHDQLPHQLNWIKLLFRKAIEIRRRNLIKTT